MTVTKDILIKVIDTMIDLTIKANISENKNIAVKNGDYELALKWRKEENDITEKLPSVEDLKLWKHRLQSSED